MISASAEQAANSIGIPASAGKLQNRSACAPVSGLNIARTTGIENGKVIVPVQDCQSFLMKEMQYKRIDNIKNNHYFKFDAEHLGSVKIQKYSEAPSETVLMTKAGFLSDDSRPTTIALEGLSQSRKQYLHEMKRQFCSAETKDTLCQRPETVDSTLSDDIDVGVAQEENQSAIRWSKRKNASEHDEPETSKSNAKLPPPRRRQSTWSFCHKLGHKNNFKRNGTCMCPERNYEAITNDERHCNLLQEIFSVYY